MKSEYKLDFQAVSDQAYGRWAEIMTELASIHEAIDNGPFMPGTCPVHGGNNGDAFRIFEDFEDTGGMICNTCGAKTNGFTALAWLNNITIKQAYQDVARFLDMDGRGKPALQDPKLQQALRLKRQQRTAEMKRKKEKQAARNLDRIRSIWNAALPYDHPEALPLRRYVENRGFSLTVLSRAIRFVPALDYYTPDPNNKKRMINRGTYPAMVALLLGPNREIFTLHRTYLDAQGNKAPVNEPKKLFGTAKIGTTSGGSIHLQPAQKAIALAEGIETSWAIYEALGIPVWATGNANNLERILIPDFIERIYIFADLDRSDRGQQAAQIAGERLLSEGKQVQVFTPPGPIPADQKGVDWGDIYNLFGANLFPNIDINMSIPAMNLTSKKSKTATNN